MAKTQYYTDELLKWETGQANALGTPLANVYLGLFTALSADGEVGTECAAAGYARLQITPAQWAAFTTPSGNARRAPTAVEKKFAQITAQVSIVGLGLFDAATGGHALRTKTIPQVDLPANSEPKFAAGALYLQED